MITKEECFNLGYVVKPIGNKGDVQFFLDVDEPNKYNELKSVFIETNQTLIPFYVSKIKIQGNFASVSIEGIDTIDKAENIAKSALYLPLSFLPPLTGKRFYFHEIIGFTVIDQQVGNIGQIETVLDYPHQAVLQIKRGDTEILIPANDQFIVEIDRAKKEFIINSPEGLIDIYLNK